MEATAKGRSWDKLADSVVEQLMETGELADLGQADLETIESEVVENIDGLTRGVISKLLSEQAKQTDRPCCCPQCQGPLREKPAQGRSLQSRRGRVHFKCDVYRCEACRLDFFPSIQNTGLRRGPDANARGA